MFEKKEVERGANRSRRSLLSMEMEQSVNITNNAFMEYAKFDGRVCFYAATEHNSSFVHIDITISFIYVVKSLSFLFERRPQAVSRRRRWKYFSPCCRLMIGRSQWLWSRWRLPKFRTSLDWYAGNTRWSKDNRRWGLRCIYKIIMMCSAPELMCFERCVVLSVVEQTATRMYCKLPKTMVM